MVEKIHHDGRLLALIIPATFCEPGVHFLTEPDITQQIAFMQHPTGKTIRPHIHNKVPRQVEFTHEALFIRRGRLRVDFYDEKRNYLESRTLAAGDVILLVGGGHGFEVLEELEMIEVKQGPFVGEADKVRFEAPPKKEELNS